MSLFDTSPPVEPERETGRRPLAERMRPRRLEDYIGQDHILGPDKPLRRQIERDQLTLHHSLGSAGSRAKPPSPS